MGHDQEPNAKSSQEEADASSLRQYEAFQRFMHECRDCQQEVDPHWQFCAHCGIRLATPCPGCGTPLPPAGALACPSCGLNIPQSSP